MVGVGGVVGVVVGTSEVSERVGGGPVDLDPAESELQVEVHPAAVGGAREVREVLTLEPLSWWPKTSLSPAPTSVVTAQGGVFGHVDRQVADADLHGDVDPGAGGQREVAEVERGVADPEGVGGIELARRRDPPGPVADAAADRDVDGADHDQRAR